MAAEMAEAHDHPATGRKSWPKRSVLDSSSYCSKGAM